MRMSSAGSAPGRIETRFIASKTLFPGRQGEPHNRRTRPREAARVAWPRNLPLLSTLRRSARLLAVPSEVQGDASRQPAQRKESNLVIGCTLQRQVGGDLTHHWSEFEAMPGKSAAEDDAVMFWMTIDDEMTVGSQ